MNPSERSVYLLAYDLGTTSAKTCLFHLGDKTLNLVADRHQSYQLKIGSNGEAEQDPEDWWKALAVSTQTIINQTKLDPKKIAGLSFCSQMQGLVLVDKKGQALRPAMSYMDQRAFAEQKEFSGRGPKIAGIGVGLLLPWLTISGGVAASVKDPLWKYLWVKKNEPELYKKVHRWLDVKEFCLARCTGRFVMSQDSAYATFLADVRGSKLTWSRYLCKKLGVDLNHLPEIVASSDKVGGLAETAAAELGLPAGTPVFAGGGDASLIGVGAGAVKPGRTHVYIGTSGWVSTVTEKRMVDTKTMIASIVGAQNGRYNYFSEQETSGKCLEWVRDHLARDEIGVYLEKSEQVFGPDEQWKSLIDYLCATIDEINPGCDGLIFTPWLRGSRCPFEDHHVRGMFFNIGLDTGKRKLIRAVVEGIAFNKRLLLDAQERRLQPSETLRFVGGGALSDQTCTILADITGRIIDAVENPQNAGAAGAAILTALGLGLLSSLDEAQDLVKVRRSYFPNPANKEVYERNYRVFKGIYGKTKKFYKMLNA